MQKDLRKKDVFNLFNEFKRFAFKGNVIDLSIGIVIGGSFSKIVSSFVDNILMPVLSILLPSNEIYKDWKIEILNKPILIGLFLSDFITFLIISFFLFLLVKKILFFLFENKSDKLSLDQKLLMEIRDLLKSTTN